jgi:hypothetical protein
MKYLQKCNLLLSLSLPLFFIQCDKQASLPVFEQDIIVMDLQDVPFRDTTPQINAVPVFDVVIREAICLQGGKRLEAVVQDINQPADLYSYQFQWKVDGVRQIEGALLPCIQGQLAEVSVTRYPDMIVVVRQLELGDGIEEAELLYDVH